jgi:hypothetical protein
LHLHQLLLQPEEFTTHSITTTVDRSNSTIPCLSPPHPYKNEFIPSGDPHRSFSHHRPAAMKIHHSPRRFPPIHHCHCSTKGFKQPTATQSCCWVSSPLLRHLPHSITALGGTRSESANNIEDSRKRGGERKPSPMEREKEDVKARSDRNRPCGKKNLAQSGESGWGAQGPSPSKSDRTKSNHGTAHGPNGRKIRKAIGFRHFTEGSLHFKRF